MMDLDTILNETRSDDTDDQNEPAPDSTGHKQDEDDEEDDEDQDEEEPPTRRSKPSENYDDVELERDQK